MRLVRTYLIQRYTTASNRTRREGIFISLPLESLFYATLLVVGFLFPRLDLTNQEEKQIRNRQSKLISEFIMGSWFSKAWNPSTDIPDLSRKVVVVTGAKFVVNVQRM
jgi:hypothetical protein